jgi:cytochrome c oxidase subunit 3
VPRHSLGEQFADLAEEEHALRFGMWVFLASELMLFAGLFALYASYRAMYPADFARAIRENTLAHGTVNMYLLLTSSATAAGAVAAAKGDRRRLTALLLGVTMLLGIAFLGVKGLEYAKHVREGALPGVAYHLAKLPGPGANRFFTLYWTLTGVHALHVAGGLGVMGWMTWRAARGFYDPAHTVTLEMGTLYWHLVDVMWIVLWPIFYLG